MTLHRKVRVGITVVGAFVVCACGRAAAPTSVGTTSVVAPTALVLAGLRGEARGDHDAALIKYRAALAAARRVYGDEHPNVAFAHAALGVWHARFGAVDDARHHLRESRRIDDARGGLFANLAETRLPASGADDAARAVMRLRLQRDLLLCALDGGCSPARVLGIGEALGEATR
jgi:Flp pilus assembly protein TadD